jgi:hypothetical protein
MAAAALDVRSSEGGYTDDPMVRVPLDVLDDELAKVAVVQLLPTPVVEVDVLGDGAVVEELLDAVVVDELPDVPALEPA